MIRGAPPRLRVILPALALLIVAGTVVLAAGVIFWAPLPTIDGHHRLLGLRERGEVIRDADGVPHVHARNLHDLFFLQGYVTAQDRLFQMDVFRRLGRGQLAAAFGEDALEADRFFRTIGLYRAALSDLDLLSEEARSALDAYAAGVNKRIGQARQGALPAEFSILGYRPQHWTVVDSLLLSRIQALDLATNYETELLRAAVARRLGPDALPALFPLLGAGGAHAGSNCVALSGERTASGLPLLAADPHLSPGNPSIWYEVGLEAPGYTAVGFSIPGAPGVVIGHNGRIAWSFTNAYVDAQDLYVERADPSDPARFLFRGRPEPATVIRERIFVRGSREPVELEVLVTRHGPILTPVLEGEQAPLALRWTAHEPGRTVDAIFAVNRARDFDEFRSALVDFQGPAQTVCYADTEGHVGWVLAGAVPRRAPGHDGTLPADGASGDHEWLGVEPAAERHFALDPPDGLVVLANQRLVDEDVVARGEWDPGFRAARLRALLEPLRAATVDDLAAVQRDVRSLAAVALLDALRAARPETELGREALALLAGWDGTMAADSAAAAVYGAWVVAMSDRVFGDVLGEELYAEYAGYGRFVVPALIALAERPEGPWYGEPAGGASPRDVTSGLALDDAARALAGRLGAEARAWRWADVHRIAFEHPLSVPPLDHVFTIGPFGVPGDGYTVNAASFRITEPFEVRSHASLRMVVDLGGLERSRSIIPTGQSGQPFSPYWGDQTARWLAGEHHPMRFSRDALGEPDGHLVFRAR